MGVWRWSLCILAACSFTPGTFNDPGMQGEAGVVIDAPDPVIDAPDATTVDAGCATSCNDNDPCTTDACVGTTCTNTPVALPANCGTGELFSCAGQTTCYARCPSLTSWTTGELRCIAWNGHLATVTSDSESTCVGTEAGAAGRYWIGYVQISGSTFEPDLGWGWASGTISLYTNWFPNQPNNNTDQISEGQDCAFAEGTSGDWYDHECNANDYGFICER